MVEGGFIKLDAGVYRNTLKGRLYAKVASITKTYLKLGAGG